MKLSIPLGVLALLISLTAITSFAQVRPPGPSQDIQNDYERDASYRQKKIEGEDSLLKRDMATAGPTLKLSKADLDRMKERRKIDPADVEKYSSFISGGNAGIFKLFPHMDCVNVTTLKTDGECAQFVPASSFFSFRTKQYADGLNSDVGLVVNEVFSAGFFSQGIFSSLGDVPIDKVALDSPGVKQLVDVQPETTFPGAKALAARLRNGIKVDNFIYASHTKLEPDKTYIFRLLAYKLGNTIGMLPDDAPRIQSLFKELTVDKRVDSMIVFRVLRLGTDGAATIVWKELSRKDASKIKFAKDEPFADFK
ncbi:MAG: hypothetical protein JO314_01635 [Acidobacteria bacterium]|nr:hypothetical protein [Acidobacteriota bacterium]